MTRSTALTLPRACAWLQARAALVPRHQCIVELGVYRGGSLAFLTHGAALGHGAHVYGIDPWTWVGMPRQGPADRGVAQAAAPDATLISAEAAEVGRTWPGPKVGLLFEDARHEYDHVMENMEAWLPHVPPGCWVAFDDHDKRFPGVIAAVAALVKAGELTPPRLIQRTAVCRRR